MMVNGTWAACLAKALVYGETGLSTKVSGKIALKKAKANLSMQTTPASLVSSRTTSQRASAQRLSLMGLFIRE